MLVITRRPNEEIVVGGNIRITVVSIHGNRVRLGIEAPADVAIHRPLSGREDVLAASNAEAELAMLD